MKKIFLLFLMAHILCYSGVAQNIAVKSFKPLAYDLSARVDYPRRDQNGELCAIIKVVTTQTNFEWEPDRLGIIAAVPRTGEVWLYVPRGAQRLTIKHPQLGVLRNYQYPVAIEQAAVYEMVLLTGEVETLVRELQLKTQWLAINTSPEGASVFIDDQLVGTTPFQRRYPEGTYNYRIELPRYYNEAGRVELKDERSLLEVSMRPRFGFIEVSSTPEEGMMIFLNGENTGLLTPATLREIVSGQHTLGLQSQWYQPQAQVVVVDDNDTINVGFDIEPVFANITIVTDPPAQVYIDETLAGNSTLNTRLLTGVYDVSARLNTHYPANRQLIVEAGTDQEITLQLRPMAGALDVATVPFNAQVTLNGENKGTTPISLQNLLVGNYTLSLILDGYATITRSVTIRNGETTEVNENLQGGKMVTITSQPTNAELTVNGNKMGTTPWNGTLPFGKSNVKLVYESAVADQNIDVVDGGQISWEFFLSAFSDFTETTSGLGMEMIAVKGGAFIMGCTSEQGADCWANEQPAHNVFVNDFFIGKYPVTQKQWMAVMGNNPSHFKRCDDCPVESVSWTDVQEFIRKLNQLTGKNYTLPTEAQWEYAARGGNRTGGFKFPGNNSSNAVAWYSDNSRSKTRPVGGKQANELGLYDMGGNVWEWCQDWYGSYSPENKTDPRGLVAGTARVHRGGAWSLSARRVRTTMRGSSTPDTRSNRIGFRLVMIP